MTASTETQKHTPGPWESQATAGYETHGQRAVYAEENGKDIAIVYDGEANARLIAAAPELLEACKALVGSDHDGKSFTSRAALATRLARAAIAKAEGREL